MKRLLYGVTTAQGAGATSATNALSVRNSAGTSLLVIGDDGAVRVGTNSSATTQTTASINASGSGTNIGLALVPKGTGAITAQIPDGTSAGGNARGTYAVDLQLERSNAIHVASGSNSFVGGGSSRTSGSYSFTFGNVSAVVGNNSAALGYALQVTGDQAFCAGGQSAAGGNYSACIGALNKSDKYGCFSSGVGSNANLWGQRTHSSGGTFQAGVAQTSDIRFRRTITGTSITELTLDGNAPATDGRAIINLPSGATAGRVWNAKIQVAAVCTVQGAGTVTSGEVFGGNYAAIIKRIGNTTSLVGTVQNLHTAQSDTNMATSVVTITADDTNESLKIEFTPPTTAAADTVIRVVATVYLTEVGY